MNRREDKNTRYFIDLDLSRGTIIRWDFGEKTKLAHEVLEEECHQRVFLTRGQFNKLIRKAGEVGG